MSMKLRIPFAVCFLFSVVACAGKRNHRRMDREESAQPSMSREVAAQKIASLNPRYAFEWPLREPVLVNFYGWRHRRMHEGVDLRAFTGTPVYAAAGGEVIYAGRSLRSYGKMVTVRHPGGWNTVYAHLSKMSVKVGDVIHQGDVIAISGNTGRSRGPHLHFELRKGSDPVDPVLYLPPPLSPSSLLTRSF